MNTYYSSGKPNPNGYTAPAPYTSGTYTPQQMLDRLNWMQVWRNLTLNEVYNLLQRYNLVITSNLLDFNASSLDYMLPYRSKNILDLKPDGFLTYLDTIQAYNMGPRRLNTRAWQAKRTLKDRFNLNKVHFLQTFSPERVYDFLNDEATTEATTIEEPMYVQTVLGGSDATLEPHYADLFGRYFGGIYVDSFVEDNVADANAWVYNGQVTPWTKPSTVAAATRLQAKGRKIVVFRPTWLGRQTTRFVGAAGSLNDKVNGYDNCHEWDRLRNGVYDNGGSGFYAYVQNDTEAVIVNNYVPGSISGTGPFAPSYPNIYNDLNLAVVKPRTYQWFKEFKEAGGDVDIVSIDAEGAHMLRHTKAVYLAGLAGTPYQARLYDPLIKEPNFVHGVTSGLISDLLGDYGTWIMADDRWQKEQPPFTKCPIKNITGFGAWTFTATVADNRQQTFATWYETKMATYFNLMFTEPILEHFPEAKISNYENTLESFHTYMGAQRNSDGGAVSGINIVVGTHSTPILYNWIGGNVYIPSGNVNIDLRSTSTNGMKLPRDWYWAGVTTIRQRVDAANSVAHVPVAPWVNQLTSNNSVNPYMWNGIDLVPSVSGYFPTEEQRQLYAEKILHLSMGVDFIQFYDSGGSKTSGAYELISVLADEFNRFCGYKGRKYLYADGPTGDIKYANTSPAGSGLLLPQYLMSTCDVNGQLVHRFTPRQDMRAAVPYEVGGYVHIDMDGGAYKILIERATVVPAESLVVPRKLAGTYVPSTNANMVSGVQYLPAPSGYWILQRNRTGVEAQNWHNSKLATVGYVFGYSTLDKIKTIAPSGTIRIFNNNTMNNSRGRTGKFKDNKVGYHGTERTRTSRYNTSSYVDYTTGQLVTSDGQGTPFVGQENMGNDDALDLDRTNLGNVTYSLGARTRTNNLGRKTD